jgi:hypothetical protein
VVAGWREARFQPGRAWQKWRGGLPSRELTRDKDFYTAHTAGQYA